MPSGVEQEVEREISHYLSTHPDAGDSIEGIRRWWLSHQLSEQPDELIERVLIRLVANGVLFRRSLPDGRELFARASSREDA